ncbi:MAG TPA: ABC transporter substrate-binding protein [Desulfomonilaceae bacterium]|nr:ABC transporter substrate-binding protein [Desulfomonilaceae bacterium]HVN81459.1 ABC transporter substrate-binding protein [Terriglobia bacterium]
MRKIGTILSFILTFSCAVSFAGEAGLTKVSLVPQWIPQAQFAGYIVALEKGFYREAGLDLTLLRGGPANPAFEALRTGKATFCTEWVSVGVQKRASGLPVVNLAQVIQKSALMLIAKKRSGITSVIDLDGKRVGSWGGAFQIQPMAFFRMYNLRVTTVLMYSTVNLFLKGGVDAVSAMWYNEYHTILNSGYNPDELTLFFFSDFGLNFPEDGLYCLEETLRADPDACARLVQASLRGWLYAFENETEALDLVMKYANAAHTGTNKAHQRWMLARMKDLILPNGDMTGFGKLKQRDYVTVSDTLKSLNLIEDAPLFTDFYRGTQ